MRIANKIPWGIIAGACAIIIFFSTIGIVAAYIILDNMAAETNLSATLFDEWYQVILFIVDTVAIIVFITSIVMFILRVSGVFTRAIKAKENEVARQTEVTNENI